jgi:hypothetical protein
MADGTRKPIEDVELGDEVLAADEETGEKTEGREVTRLIRGEGDKILVTITISDASGEMQQIVATDAHPFWLAELQAWVDAIDLQPGAWLQTSAGTWAQVTAISARRQHAVVHNLTVDVDHTYYVAASQNAAAVLVHNCGGQIGYNSDDLSSAAFKARQAAGIPAGRNVAAARVDGLEDPIIGFSKGGGYHSENDILDQLARKGIDPRRITHLYSERQPCSVCGPLLADHAPNALQTWSVPWGRDAAMNSAANDLLRRMISTAGG